MDGRARGNGAQSTSIGGPSTAVMLNTARHALFLWTSREAKFKAKQAIDSLCWRLGDVLQAGAVLLRLKFS